MTRIHKRFATEQVKALLQQYSQATKTRVEVEDILEISKSWSFILLAAHRCDPGQSSVSYAQASSQRLSSAVEAALEHELRREKGLIGDKCLPISSYNYSASRIGLARTACLSRCPRLLTVPNGMDVTSPRARPMLMTEKSSRAPLVT